ncbi:Triose-phosphate transporter [Pleurostoma richardsiae]|uniref:Triose-phosphate transporter n=1 Tax=Pleurostoma richardsiae TaxID=41990 RepID=A0AA38RKR3_9PEZI|nr:Triose-phosphate transporter [Pleurostoma richardsiae]
MPHSTSPGSSRRAASQSRVSVLKTHGDAISDSLESTEKFPDFDAGLSGSHVRSASPRKLNGYSNRRASSTDRWLPRSNSQTRGVRWGLANQSALPAHASGYGHGRQRSISNALNNIRGRAGSMSQNAHEIAGVLRAPVSPKLIMLCVMWYASSAMTNTSSKSILNVFDKPATLTLVQFAFVSACCVLFSWLASVFPTLRTAIPALKHGIRPPSVEAIRTTLPLAAFQIAGHLLSSTATSKIPVSLVHTIKGLSPLFTVFAYRFVFDIRYPVATYLSLIPLTLGVMLACSGNRAFGGELLGIIYALLATVIFVTQNIFSKRLFNEAARAEAEGMTAQSRKLDKLNLLCYSSGLAFILTAPIWFWSEGVGIMGDFFYDGSVDLNEGPNTFDHGRLFVEFVFNGTFHFWQNILAFVLLSLVSPVTYSVASLIKRVFVIVIAILWFRNPTTKVQAAGVALTFLGLYLYDRSSESNKADRRAKMMTETGREEPLLPLTSRGPGTDQMTSVLQGSTLTGSTAHAYSNSRSFANGEDHKKSDEMGGGRARGSSNAAWLPPGTRQETTWRIGDRVAGVA